MIRQSTRKKGPEIDYKVFVITGERLSRSNESKEEMPDHPDTSLINESVLADEITDFMDDNNPESIQNSPELMLNSIEKIESLRMQYRKEHCLIKHQVGDNEYETKYSK